MIDTTKNVKFTSDRGSWKYSDFNMTDIIFENNEVCLCNSDINELILFDKKKQESSYREYVLWKLLC